MFHLTKVCGQEAVHRTIRRCAHFLLAAWAATAALLAQGDASAELAQLKQEAQQQRAALDRLLARIEALEARTPTAPVPATPPEPVSATQTAPAPASEPPVQRDSVGDLNTAQVLAGEFPGAIGLPGRDISLGITGFVKTIVFQDSNSETRSVIFLPALLGASRDDRNGASAISSELTRLGFDARARLGTSRFRGYIEYDLFGNTLNWRHGYLTWDDRWGQILAGKYWSNFMDLQTLPEGLSEPTASGAIFARQGQFRFTRPLSKRLSWATSFEDPASSDITVAAPVKTRTAFPDITTAFTLRGEASHLRIGGLVRRITIDPDGQPNFGATGWGVNVGAHADLGSRDRLVFAGVYGKGLGRYLLGILPTGGAFVDEPSRYIAARPSFGLVTSIRHRWNKPCRSTVGVGYASVETDRLQPDTALRASLYGLANYLCTVSRFVTIGGEYTYGRRWNKSGGQDNNRFAFGMQLF
jgi:hypothetical protein